MTIDLKTTYVDNVYVPNEVFYASNPERYRVEDLACVGWITSACPVREAHQVAMMQAGTTVLKALRGYNLWLLACHTAWQPDTRVVRFRKLWESLGAESCAVPEGRLIPEHVVEGASGVRWCAGSEVTGQTLPWAAKVIEEERASHLVSVREDDDNQLSSIVRSGWMLDDWGPSREILHSICGQDGLVFWPIGAFDDREAGITVIGKRKIIRNLIFG